MIILRILLRLILAIGRLLLVVVKKSVKLTLAGVATAAILMVLDALLLEAENDRHRPDAS
ncbi:MAG: hypothetical protein ABIQ34_07870 [Tepidiformaceae bacterium]